MSDLSVAVLLVNLGTPSACKPAAVRTYLREFLSDRRVIALPFYLRYILVNAIIAPFRARQSAKKYAEIWQKEGSPLKINTHNICESLKQHFESYPQVHIEYAMRYGQPNISEVLQSISQKNIGALIVLPLYPQYAESTTASVFDALYSALAKKTLIPSLYFVNDYSDHPAYINALALQIQQHWQQHGQGKKIVFSYHGLPQKSIALGDPYYSRCQKTSLLLAEKLELKSENWEMAFQSRFGLLPWLEPDTGKTLIRLAKEGIKHVDVFCPGFACDCLETLEEINIGYRASFLEAGGEEFRYIPALNNQPNHIKMLAEIIDNYLKNNRS